MSNWPTRTLGEICREGGGFIRTGPFGSQLHRSDYTEDPQGIPVVMPKDMTRGRINTASIARIDEPTADRLKQHLLSANDIVLARRGDVSRTAWVFPEDLPAFCGTGSIRVHPGESGTVRPAFLRFYFHTKLASDYLEGHAVGSTMPNLNAGIVERLPVPVPPLRIQDSLTGVLEAFDDLIENNRRRVDILEEMARAIYREWFQKFRYPGHGDVPLVDSAVGPIPEGWGSARLGEIAEVRRGISWERSNETVGGTPVVTIPNVRSRLVLAGATELASISDADRLRFGLRGGDLILIGSNGNPDRVGHAIRVPDTVEALFASFLMRVRVHDARTSSLFLFHQLTDPRGVIDAIRATAVGATGLRNLRISALRDAQVLLPPAIVIARFESASGPLVRLADQLGKQNDWLESIRDALLPKLVTGQIDVSKLDLDALLGEQVA